MRVRRAVDQNANSTALRCAFLLPRPKFKRAWLGPGKQKRLSSNEERRFDQSDLARIQTWNLQSRNLMLYSVELRGLIGWAKLVR